MKDFILLRLHTYEIPAAMPSSRHYVEKVTTNQQST